MADLFTEKAQQWDANEMVMQLSSAIGSTMLKQVPLHAQMQVLDFGAGTGLICSQIAAQVDKVVAIDISEAMLEKLVAKQELQGKVEAICQDITATPLDRKFDLIVSAMAMHHVEDTEQLLASFAQHLNANGKVALADLDQEDGTFHPEDIEGVFHLGFEREKLQAIMEQQGFKEIKFVTAHTVEKGEKGEKDEKRYPVFLVTAVK